jgi:hypothetical protein
MTSNDMPPKETHRNNSTERVRFRLVWAEAPYSHLGQDADYPESDFRGFPVYPASRRATTTSMFAIPFFINRLTFPPCSVVI